MTFTKKNKVAVVAMSGGIDSNAASLLLVKQGYEVIGLTGIMFNNGEIVKNAAKACDILGIKHETLDLKEVFKNTVIKYFEESYKIGLTPNPCTFCNKIIKWEQMTNFAFKELKADFYATGHYAKIKKNNENYAIYRAEDLQKDQSYMLFALNQENLSKTLFPLGEFKKTEIRELVKKTNLAAAKNKESQDVCFIQPPQTIQSYLTDKFTEKQGKILDYKTNKILGKHKGTFNYTIGQRKGIGVSAPEPLYVISLNPAENKIYVGNKENLSAIEFCVTDVNWQQEEYLEKDCFQVMVKVRYNSDAQEATVFKTGKKTVHVKLKDPQFAITPGQAAVFYDLNNEYLFGGGIITAFN